MNVETTQQPEEPGPRRPTGAPERWQAPFFLIWSVQALSLLGSQLAQFALIWWLTQKTGSATVLTGATLIAVVPIIVLGPIIGALVDRWNRRLVMIVADTVTAAAAAVILYLVWAGTIQLWQVYVALVVRSIGSAFHWPAMTAATTLMVPESFYTRVQGLNQAINGLMNIVAPALGALMLAVAPLYSVLAIDTVTAIIAVAPLFFVKLPEPVKTAKAGARLIRSIWSDLLQGLRYIRSWPALLILLAISALVNFFLGPVNSLTPILVTKDLAGGVLELGWLNSVSGVGVVVGGIVLSAWGGTRRRIVTSLIGLIGMGAGILMLGLAPASMFWLALTGMFISDFMAPIANGPIGAILQARVPPELQGRVFTANTSIVSAMAPLGLVAAGPLADVFGARLWYIMAGVACMAVGALGFSIRVLVHLEDARDAADRTPGQLHQAPGGLRPADADPEA